MEFIDDKIQVYAEKHTCEEPELLQELNRETWAKVLMPRMLSGHLQGRALAMFSKMIQPELILEIGTYTGYSALCLAEGLAPGGKLITIDINEELETILEKYFSRSEYSQKIERISGNATEIIPGLNHTFDLVFIDADKENYSVYFDLVFDKIRPGGYIIADNVLWSGNVLKSRHEMDEETMAIDNFNKKVQQDPRCENILLPFRDGLMVIRKMDVFKEST
jgi:predicted O-methyltransferase YrrM